MALVNPRFSASCCGEIVPDTGQITKKNGIRIGYLPQDIELPGGKSLIDTAMIKPLALARVEARLDAIEKRLAEPAVYEDEQELSRVLEQHSALIGDFESMNGASSWQPCARAYEHARF